MRRARCGRAVAVRGVSCVRRSSGHFVFAARYCTRASSLSAGIVRLERRHRARRWYAWRDVGVRVDDRLVDEVLERLSGVASRPALEVVEDRADLALRRRDRAEGVAGAAALVDERRLARTPPAAAPAASRPRLCLAYHASKSAFDITIAWLRMSEWPRPQSSVQMTGHEPSLFGVITRLWSVPGTASCFWANCGTQKPVDHVVRCS